MPWTIALFLWGVFFAASYFVFSLITTYLYRRYILVKSFEALTKPFNLILRFLLSIIMAISAGILFILSSLVFFGYNQITDPYRDIGLGDYYQTPLVYPYVLSSADDPGNNTCIERYYNQPSSYKIPVLCSVSQVAVEDGFIFGLRYPRYFLLSGHRHSIKWFATEEELKAAWKHISKTPFPTLKAPGEFYNDYSPPAKYDPFGIFVYSCCFTSISLVPLFWLAPVHYYYYRKNRRLLRSQQEV